MDKKITVSSAPKNTVFQIRMNSEIKSELEEVFAKSGISLTDAINIFFQQSLNMGGLPFVVNQNPDFTKRMMAYMDEMDKKTRED